MIDFPTIAFLIVIIAIATYFIGYSDGRAKQRKQRQAMAEAIDDLEDRVVTLNRRLQNDPERAAIDHGMNYVLNQISELIRHIRDGINNRIADEEED